MGKAKWSFESASTIKDDVKNAMIDCVEMVLYSQRSNENRLAMLDGMYSLYLRLKGFVEETPDENIPND